MTNKSTPDPRQVESISSVQHLLALLDNIISEPAKYRSHLICGYLHSQNALASFTDSDVILSMSLNRMKRAAKAILDNGYADLDSKREIAKNQIAKLDADNAPSTDSIEIRQRAEIQQLRAELLAARQDLFHLTKILNRSMRQARAYADMSSHTSTIALCRKEQWELTAELTNVRNLPAAKG